MELGAFVVHELTGDWPVYPGHPLVIATAIMRVFGPEDQQADVKAGRWSAALQDSRIPGAGDHVRAAIRLLDRGACGETLDSLVESARSYWTEGQAGGHDKNVVDGQAQADRIEGHFRSTATAWFATAKARR